MATSAIGSYLVVHLLLPEARTIDHSWFVMRCLVFLGVAGVVTNLARTRHKELRRLIDVHKEITDAIVSGSKLALILNLILRKGLEFTNSEAGHIRLLNEDTGEYKVVTSIGDSKNQDWSLSAFADEYSSEAARLRKHIVVNRISETPWQESRSHLLRKPRPQSALFVPLGGQERVIAVVVVSSNWSGHYGRIDVRRLKAFAPLIEMALKTNESAERLKKLTEAESYYRELIDNAPDPIIVLDKDGRIVVFNKACEDLWGYKFKEEVLKEPEVAKYYKSEEHAREIAKMLWKSEGNRKENFNAWIKHKNGEIIPISLSACFVKKGKELDRSIGVYKDRRHAIKMSEKVLQAERFAIVGGLAGTIGHDIRHNIATALNYLNALLNECDPEREPDLHRIYSNMTSALQESVAQFNQVLTAHRPRMPQKKKVMAGEIFREVEERMREQALDKNIKFVVKYPEPDISVSVDMEQMVGVLSNLFTNSLHAIDLRKETDAFLSEGLIELSARFNQTEVQLIWKDNGCGIAEEDSINNFNAFVTSKGNNGTGLGLFIVKSIIQNHDGRIELESKLGEGATFHIQLPIPKAGPPEAADSLMTGED
jgi:PAS domain S-box-containing protein